MKRLKFPRHNLNRLKGQFRPPASSGQTDQVNDPVRQGRQVFNLKIYSFSNLDCHAETPFGGLTLHIRFSNFTKDY